MKRKALPLLLFVIALVLCWPRLVPLPEARFATSAIPGNISPVVRNVDTSTQLLPRAGASAHAVTLAQGADGRIIAAWFSGSREGAADVVIVSATYANGAWSAPRVIADRHVVERDTQRLIRKLGNPVLWRSPDKVLHLWFVSVSYGGWAGSAINHTESIDDGQHWSRIERVVTSPFLNLSTLVRNPPLALADGGVALPVYHELLNKRPEWLHFDSHRVLVDQARVPGSAGTLQPAAVALNSDSSLLLLRDAGPMQRIHASHSEDGGTHWQPAMATAIDNPNAAIALTRLADGSLLLACNPLTANRNQLALLRSRDAGNSWSTPYVIEQGAVDDEFSYPALLQDDKGVVHLAYTWKRQAIKHVVVTPAQIEAMQ